MQRRIFSGETTPAPKLSSHSARHAPAGAGAPPPALADAEQRSIASYVTHSSAGNSSSRVLEVKPDVLNSTLGQADSQQKEKYSKRTVVMQPEWWSRS